MLFRSCLLDCFRQKHSFHILSSSPFPFLVSPSLLIFLVPLTFYLHGIQLFGGLSRADMIHIGFLGLYLTAMSWFLSILKESRQEYHTKKVQKGLRLGMILFILSEVMLFFALFWGFFHFSLIPSVAVGGIWPPTGTQHLDVWGLPLVNTLLLLTSGLTITVAHAYILRNSAWGFAWYLFLTIVLGAVFLFCQAYEYKHGVKFSWRDNIYGLIFLITSRVPCYPAPGASASGSRSFTSGTSAKGPASSKGLGSSVTSIAVAKPPLSSYRHMLMGREKFRGFYDEDDWGLFAWYRNVMRPLPTYRWKLQGYVVCSADPQSVWITDCASAKLGSTVFIDPPDLDAPLVFGEVIRVADPLRLVKITEGAVPPRDSLVFTYNPRKGSAPTTPPTKPPLLNISGWWRAMEALLRRLSSGK